MFTVYALCYAKKQEKFTLNFLIQSVCLLLHSSNEHLFDALPAKAAS
jgi:hypothetical protein